MGKTIMTEEVVCSKFNVDIAVRRVLPLVFLLLPVPRPHVAVIIFEVAVVRILKLSFDGWR